MPRKKKVNTQTDDIYRRLEDCQLVVDHLKDCPAWRVIRNDLLINKQDVDDRWQEIFDEEKLRAARVVKMAYHHLINLEKTYEEELENFKKQVKDLTSTETEIIKDYDTD